MKRAASGTVIVLLLFLSVAGCDRGRSDQAVANEIKAKLFSDPVLKASNIDVDVIQGAVTLRGSVPNLEVQLQAYRLATQTPGVQKVLDQMRVEGGQIGQAPGQPPAVTTMDQPRGIDLPPNAPPQSNPVPPRVVQPPPVGGTAEPATAERVRPPAPVVEEATVPTGTAVAIRMVDTIDSGRSKPGQLFRAVLDSPVILGRYGVIPANSDVTVRLAEARSAGHLKGQSELELQLVRLTYHGRSYPIVSNSYEDRGSVRGKQTAKRTGIAAAAGALIGAIAGRGKGAAIGAAAGGGGAVAYQGFTRGQQVRVESEQRLVFRLQAPLTVVVAPLTRGR